MRAIITAVLLCVLCNISWAAETGISASKQARIQQLLNNWRARSGIPSAALSIMLPGQPAALTITSGTTSYASGEKTKGDTLFQAGSITKSFTSTIILNLEAQGKLNINDPITKYLPQYQRWHNVTIRQLLNHTSGIYNYTTAGAFNNIRKYSPAAQFTPEAIVNIALQHRDYFPPGQGWKYSNTNYVLAGMIIQKVSGQPVDAVMNHYLHGGSRLNLLHTFYLAGKYSMAFISRMAHGYSSEGHDVTWENMSWAGSAGAIVTTTEDLLIWWRGLFHYQILPPQQMAQLTTLVCEGVSRSCYPGEHMPHLTDNEVGKGYGLGVIQSGYGSRRVGTVWWHNGSTKGFKAIVMWFPKSNIYMALAINRDPGYLLKPSLPVIQRILNLVDNE